MKILDKIAGGNLNYLNNISLLFLYIGKF